MKFEEVEKLNKFLAELLERIEKLECDNEELRQQLTLLALSLGNVTIKGDYAMRVS